MTFCPSHVKPAGQPGDLILVGALENQTTIGFAINRLSCRFSLEGLN